MGERAWEIGICGTFDVANYGDLLFPLIAEAELRERLGAVTLHRFSYNCKTKPEWPFAVTSVAELPQVIDRLDGLLIGGGFLIRFDKEVAPGYAAPTPELHHPTGYWLTPALMALQRDVPVVWNAPGTDGKDVPAWAAALMGTALDHSRYVSVRDEPSRLTLQALTRAHVAVVPDTAFGLARLWNLEAAPSSEFQRLCDASGLDGPYIVIQAKAGFEGFVRFVKKNAGRFRNFRFLALPIGPALGDREDLIDADLPGIIRLAEWPSPLVIAELIARSEAVIGYSYHLCITALAAGVPVFARHHLPMCKYSVLHKSDAFFVLPPDGEPDLERFLARLGRTIPSAMARCTLDALRAHWDCVAGALRAEAAPTSPALNRFWQSLPTLLEDAGPRESAAANGARRQLAVAQDESDALRKRLDDTVRQLSVAHAQTAARDARITNLMTSVSWRLTAPLRLAAQQVLKHRKRRIINLDSIRHHMLKTDPYQWAYLLSAEDVAKLAETYPCDHFKLVSSYHADRQWEYETRALIGMGSDTVAYPEDLSEAWRALATDLLSPGYRAAMTALTGRDLTQSPMEVNVFHYGPGGSLSAHLGLPEKLVTHVLYFNRSWNTGDGGCLRILRSTEHEDFVAEIPPIAGYSSILVRSESSWHAVTRVADNSPSSRRSVTITFYRPGSVSTLWPPGDATPLHRYHAADLI